MSNYKKNRPKKGSSNPIFLAVHTRFRGGPMRNKLRKKLEKERKRELSLERGDLL